MTTVGIINAPKVSTGKSVAMKQIIEQYGFNVIIIGHDVDLQSQEMRDLMDMDRLTILDEHHRKLKAWEKVKPQTMARNCGPRNRWGALK